MIRLSRYVVMLAVCAFTSTAHAAGFRFVNVPADPRGPAFRAAVWSPCDQPPGLIDLGRTTLPGVKDCPLPLTDKKLPLIVISHGQGGFFGGHHDTAEALAEKGFIVAALDHPGDTGSDMSRSADLSVFVERPTDIERLIDFMLVTSPMAHRIDADRIGFFGFSRGGYTGLVAIGGDPDWGSAADYCRRMSSSRLCRQILAGEYPAGAPAHDGRIKAAVIADPLAIFFSADSLGSIKVPVQLWASELGGDGVLLRDVAPLDKSLTAPHEFRIVQGAGHFAFFLCPPALLQSASELCIDRSGFDRAAFHKEFNTAVVEFLQDKTDRPEVSVSAPR